jgi:hypothetical protein
LLIYGFDVGTIPSNLDYTATVDIRDGVVKMDSFWVSKYFKNTIMKGVTRASEYIGPPYVKKEVPIDPLKRTVKEEMKDNRTKESKKLGVSETQLKPLNRNPKWQPPPEEKEKIDALFSIPLTEENRQE